MATNRFLLGGVPPRKWLTARRVGEIAVLVAAATVILSAIAVTHSVWLIGALIVVAGGFGAMFLSKNLEGEFKIFDVGTRLRCRLAVAGRWDDFDPAREDAPWLSDVTAVEDVQGTGVIRYQSAVSCVLEVVGGGEGIRADSLVRRWDRQYARVARKLGQPSAGVDQVEFITVVRPQKPQTVRAAMDAVSTAPGYAHLRASMDEAADRIAGMSETTRSWAVIRFDVGRLMEYVATPPYTATSQDEATLTALHRVIDVLGQAGYTVAGVLDVAHIAGLARAMLCPDRDVDDTSGTDGLWSSLPAWTRTRDGSAIRVGNGQRTWWHATGGFSRDDWPVEPVPSRWTEPLVFGRSGFAQLSGPRVIVSKIRVLSPFQSRDIAMSQKTTAAGRLWKEQKEGDVNTDESAAKLRTTEVTTRAIVAGHEIGVIPDLRIMVSARDEVGLRMIREQAASAVLDMGSVGLTWDSSRPGAGLLDVLPIGREVKIG